MGGQSYSPLIYENILAGKYISEGLVYLCGERPQKRNRSFGARIFEICFF